MKAFSKIVLLILWGILSFSAFSQNGWTRKKNSFYGQALLSTFNSAHYISATGNNFTEGATYRNNALLFYGEYGVTDRFNVLLDVPLLVINKFSTTEAVAGMGNAKIGLKYRLFKNFPLSAQVDLSIPTDDGFNYARSLEPNLLGTYDQINLPTSDGEFNVWTTLAASKAWFDGNLFASLYSSVNFRTQNFSHQLQAGMELGYLFFNRFYLIGKFKIQEKISSGTATGSIFYGEGTTFSQYSVVGILKLNKKWNLVGGFSDYMGFPIEMRNIYNGFQFYIGTALEI